MLNMAKVSNMELDGGFFLLLALCDFKENGHHSSF